MTLSTTTNRASFAGSGTTGPFTFTFPFNDDTEISVFTLTSTGVVTDLTSAQYVLTGAGDEDGGSVTTNDVVASGTTLFVMRTVTLDQTTDLINNGIFYNQTHEDTFDRLTMQIQQLQEQLNRCIRMPKEVTSDQTLSATRCGTYLYFDDTGAVSYEASVTLSESDLTVVYAINSYQILAGLADVLIINTDDANCTITPQSGDTICWGSSITMSIKDESVRLVKNGTNWYKIN